MRSLPIRCRSCGAEGLEPVLSLGKTPLANALVPAERLGDPEPVYPLDLAFCPECALVQITASVPPEELFTEYPYFSSYSDTMVRHARDLAERLIEERRLDGGSLVVEAASNDGYLLQHYLRRGVPVLGIEPARNIAEVARTQHGIATLNEFFASDLARRLRDERRLADVFHAHNVLAHVPDLNGFTEGIATVLKPKGVALIEVPYCRDMIERLEFDTIYHEHLSYFSLAAARKLFERHGLGIIDVERIEIHGGSLRLTAAQRHTGMPVGPAVAAMLEEETVLGMQRAEYYRDFASRVEKLKEALTGLLSSLKAAGKSIAAYGASAKGSTLLNAFEIGGDVLDFIADRSPHKQGKFSPGAKLPILAPEALLERQPDYTLLLTWNFCAEILEQQKEYRRRGGRFIIPIPEPEVV